MRLTDILTRFSVGQLKRLVKAKAVSRRRERLVARVESLNARLEDARGKLERLDRRIDKLVRNGRARGARGGRKSRQRSPGRPPKRDARRGPRKGSLRAHLIETIKKAGAAPAKALAELVVKAGYKTTSKPVVFLRAVHQALAVNPEFAKKNGKYGLR